LEATFSYGWRKMSWSWSYSILQKPVFDAASHKVCRPLKLETSEIVFWFFEWKIGIYATNIAIDNYVTFVYFWRIFWIFPRPRNCN
jgi:hypothetical protein